MLGASDSAATTPYQALSQAAKRGFVRIAAPFDSWALIQSFLYKLSAANQPILAMTYQRCVEHSHYLVQTGRLGQESANQI